MTQKDTLNFQNIVENHEKLPLLEYKILRESKTIKFQDINLIEDETKYLINFKQEIDPSKKYLLITPFSYFRIPEKVRMNIKPELMEIDSTLFFEKIIWYYILEIIYKNGTIDNEWREIKDDLVKRVREPLHRLKKRYKKERFLRTPTKEKIKNIDLKKFFESEVDLKDILDYSRTRRKHITYPRKDLKNLFLKILIFSCIFSMISSFFSTFLLLLGLWFMGVFIYSIVYYVIYYYILQHRITKKGGLKQKLEEILKNFSKEVELDSRKKKKFFRKYLDDHSNELFMRIYNATYNNLYEAIKDYKTFNPFSTVIKFDEKEIIPETLEHMNYFRNLYVVLDFSKIPIKNAYQLTIQTNRTIGAVKKKNKISREKMVVEKTTFPILIVLFALPFLNFYLFYNFEHGYIFLLIFSILFVILFFYAVNYNYKYYSGLQEPRKEINQSSSLLFHKFNKSRETYSIPTNLRRNCSYDWVIHAPKFHYIRIDKEIKRIIKNLERPIVLRLPHELSKNILSFHIPKSTTIREADFQLDLEIRFTGRIIGWLIGMNVMLFNTLSVSILYIIFSFNPNVTLELSDFRIVLTFLTLLIGFFGKNILEKPTKDLNKWGAILIFLTVVIGFLLFFGTISDIFG